MSFRNLLSRLLGSVRFKLAVSIVSYLLLFSFLKLKIGVLSKDLLDFDRLDAVIIVILAIFPLFVFFAKSMPWWDDPED